MSVLSRSIVITLLSLLTSINIMTAAEEIEFGNLGFPYTTSSNLEEHFKKLSNYGFKRAFYHLNADSFSDSYWNALKKQGKISYTLAEAHSLASKYGIELIPIINTRIWSRKVLKNDGCNQIYQPSGEEDKYLCPKNPKVGKVVRQQLKKVLKSAETSGIELKTIGLDDEYMLGMDFRGKGWCCYCDYCRAYFKKKTGWDAPYPVYQKTGYIVSDNDPLLKWIELMGPTKTYGSEAIRLYNEDLYRTAKGINPQIKVCQIPGGYYGELDCVIHELYNYFYGGIPELNTLFELDLVWKNQTSSTKKPIWPLIGYSDTPPFPDWFKNHINLMTKLAVSKRAKAVDFAFLCYSKNSSAFSSFANNYLKPVIDDVKSVQSILLKIKPKKMPIAVLFSDTTVAYQGILKWDEAKANWNNEKKWKESMWEHYHSLSIAYPALLLAHLPVEIITEREILDGKLKDYQALILVNYQYSTRSIFDKIEKYSKNGMPVFADKSSSIKPDGTKIIPMDFSVWARLVELGLRPAGGKRIDFVYNRQKNLVAESRKIISDSIASILPQPIKIDNYNVAYTLSTDDKKDYLFLFNSDLKQNHNISISINHKVSHIYDVLTGQELLPRYKEGKTIFDTSVLKGDWKIFSIDKLTFNKF